jgi:Aldo/keto reductase family.
MKEITLNNGVKMPQLGLGVWQIPEADVVAVVKHALKSGYRLIDTAMIYRNEAGVGRAIKESGIPRKDIFLTTKLWNKDQGYDKTLRAFEESLSKLDTDYIDLYLIHWPMPRYDRYVETYKAMEKLYKEGRVRAIGVSNFDIEHLERILNECEIPPVINQVECHPYLQQNELLEYCRKHQIVLEAYSPLMNGRDVLKDPVIKELAEKYGKTPAQIILRWHIERGTVVIPKSVTPSRIEENIQVFDFQLEKEDLAKIAALDRGLRINSLPSEYHDM